MPECITELEQESFNSMAPGCHWCPIVMWTDGSELTTNLLIAPVKVYFQSADIIRAYSARMELRPKIGAYGQLLAKIGGRAIITPD